MLSKILLINIFALFLVVFSCPNFVIGDSHEEKAIILDALDKFEKLPVGRRIRFEQEGIICTFEINESLDAARTELLSGDHGSMKGRVGHSCFYIAPALGLELVSSGNGVALDKSTRTTTHSVKFTPIPDLIDYLYISGRLISYGNINGIGHRKFAEQSKVIMLPSQDGLNGIRCQHPNGPEVHYYVNRDGQLTIVKLFLNEGDPIYDGTKLKKGQWEKTEQVYTYRTPELDSLASVYNSLERNDYKKTSAVDRVTECVLLSKALPSLIELDESYGLVNGTQVFCNEQHGRHFEFLDGKIVAGVDLPSVQQAQAARFKSSPIGRVRYYGWLVGGLALVVGILLWKRK